jgi:hypothetical protein
MASDRPPMSGSGFYLMDAKNRREAYIEPPSSLATKLLGDHARKLAGSGGVDHFTNIQRRHLSKGQQAKAVAKALLVTNKNQTHTAKEIGISQSRVSNASVVLDHLPDLADEVLAGVTSLDVAYEKAKENVIRLFI